MDVVSLIELCRVAKEQQRYTLQDISDGAEVPIDTVKSVFSRSGKNTSPTINTMAPICAFLGVSIDQFCGMPPVVVQDAELTKRLHAAEMEITRLRGIVDKQTAIMSLQRKNGIAISAISFAVIVALLVRLLVFDHSIPDAGLIINGETTLGAWLLIGGVAAVGVLLGVLLLRMAMRNTPKIEEREVGK